MILTEPSVHNWSNKSILLFFVLSSLFIWHNTFSFFLGDDWSFIFDYAEGKSFTDYVFAAHGGHVIPLFQTFYTTELILFGKNVICFQFLSVLMWGLTSFILYSVFIQISSGGYSKIIAIIISLLFCLHPNSADVVYWVFQQGVILHLLFQALTILFYIKFIKENSTKHFTLFILFLFFQNYFFGNGVLFPGLFLGHYLLEKRKINDKFIFILLFFQLLFIFVQKSLSLQEINFTILFENRLDVVISFFKLVYVSLVRFFFIKQVGGNLMVFLSLILFTIICFLAYRNEKRFFSFALLYLIISSISIPMARFQIASFDPIRIHYYYSVLLFPPLFFLLFLAVSKSSLQHTRILLLISSVYLIGFYFVNIQAKRIYAYKQFKNKEALNNAILYSKKNYYPFEDAMFSSPKHIYQDNLLNESVQKSVLKSSYFEADSTIINYLGKETYKFFIFNNARVIKNYKYLENKSYFSLDLTYEKH